MAMTTFTTVQVLITLLLLGTKNVKGQECPEIDSLNEYYADSPDCNDVGTLEFSVYEDAPVDEPLFQVDPDYEINSSECYGIYMDEDEENQFGFSSVGDAEDKSTNELVCTGMFIKTDNSSAITNAVFTFIDVNEYLPEPADGLGISESINVNENEKGSFYQFSYTDQDSGEVDTLECVYDFDGDAGDIFKINDLGVEGNVKMFELETIESIDFEANSFFSLEATFQSHDGRGNSSSVIQSFFIFVQDLGDNPPFFTVVVPSVTILEEDEDYMDSAAFQVTAIDGDISINNKIHYSISSGNDDGYFTIDEETGEVFTVAPIDREDLNTTLFSLEIEATEVDDEGNSISDQGTAIQVTNVNIEDVNDNVPSFLNDSFSVTTEEFYDTSVTSTKSLDVVIIVEDLDEGSAGQYDLTTSNPNVVMSPTSGTGSTNFGITLKKSDDFDYDLQQENPFINVTITATEREDNGHSSSLTVTIELVDVNDNVPVFDQESYSAEVDETVDAGSPIIALSATDADSSSEFNEDSFKYLLTGCSQFSIDENSGLVTLGEGESLDYEEEKEITCTAGVQDMEGASDESLGSTVSLTVNVLDVNDEVPVFVQFEDTIDIYEDTSLSSEIYIVEVIDNDTSAVLEVSMKYSNNPGSEVESWFLLEEDESSKDNHYVGNLIVGEALDREVVSQVIVDFQATDEEADVGTQLVTRTLTINILDVNDETPEFVDDYSQLDYDENTEEGTVVLIVVATDPDLDDEIFYSIEDEEGFLDINSTTGEVFILNEVDREEIDSFEVEIAVQDLVNHTQTVQMEVTINDMNDNAPQLDKDVCSKKYSVSEGDEDGSALTTVTATDADVGIHAKISYILMNLNLAGDEDQFAPFIIDVDTGEMTVNTSGNLILDREVKSAWQLSVRAYDNCDTTEPFCSINYDECVMNVTITDINDNPPQNYKSNEDIVTDEFLIMDEVINGIEISAFDPDEANDPNSQITFELVDMWTISSTPVDPPLFEAVTHNRTSPDDAILEYYCNLRATKNLTGLRGDYIIRIKGSDFGDEVLFSYSNFSVTIKDANDMSPKFSYAQCLEDNDLIITMTENITDLNTPLNCNADDEISRPANIYITDDDDPTTDNAEVTLTIDYYESTVVEGGAENQLEAFSVYTYSESGVYAIQITEKIDREKGSEYNLTLVAKDKGDIPLSTESWFYVIVKDYSEYDPTFCASRPCNQTLYIKENSNTTTEFNEAEDKDNSEDEINDIIYYSIIEGDIDTFYIPVEDVAEIRPKLPLDRESIETYDVVIMASNRASGTPPEDIEQTNQVLRVHVVILDENDEVPTFDEIIYGDFLDTGNKGDQVALLEFIDKDLNDTLTYTFDGPFLWNEGQNYTEPFKINQIDDRNSEIILNMDPEGKYGYCTVTVRASDEGDHSSSAVANIFVVTNEFIVPFYFYNDIEDVERNKDNVESIFTDVFNYTCIIDSIEKAVNSNNEEIDGETIVFAHFIQEIRENYYVEGNQREVQPTGGFSLPVEKLGEPFDEEYVEYELVPESVIEEYGTSGLVTSELDSQLSFLGLNLARIGDTERPDDEEDKDQQIINLKISIGTVTLFLGLLIILILTMFYIRTSKLKRQLKVSSTKTIDEKTTSHQNEFGVDMGQTPGSNFYSQEGSNPIFNLPDEGLKEVTKDDDSESWSSELVGIEDNPEFVAYLQKRAEIGEASVTEDPPSDLNGPNLPPFGSINKVNPLLMGAFGEEATESKSDTLDENNENSDLAQLSSLY